MDECERRHCSIHCALLGRLRSSPLVFSPSCIKAAPTSQVRAAGSEPSINIGSGSCEAAAHGLWLDSWQPWRMNGDPRLLVRKGLKHHMNGCHHVRGPITRRHSNQTVRQKQRLPFPHRIRSRLTLQSGVRARLQISRTQQRRGRRILPRHGNRAFHRG